MQIIKKVCIPTILIVLVIGLSIFGVYKYKTPYKPSIINSMVVQLDTPIILTGEITNRYSSILGYSEDIVYNKGNLHISKKRKARLANELNLSEDTFSNLQLSAFFATGLHDIFGVDIKVIKVPDTLNLKKAKAVFNSGGDITYFSQGADFGLVSDGSIPYAYYKIGNSIYGIVGAYDYSQVEGLVKEFSQKISDESFDYLISVYGDMDKDSEDYPSNYRWTQSYYSSTAVLEQVGSYFIFCYGPDSKGVANSLRNMLTSNTIDVEPFSLGSGDVLEQYCREEAE